MVRDEFIALCAGALVVASWTRLRLADGVGARQNLRWILDARQWATATAGLPI
jgi:hypothetical protein